MKKFHEALGLKGTQEKSNFQLSRSLSNLNWVYVNPFCLKSYPEEIPIVHLGVNVKFEDIIREFVEKSF